MKVEEVNTRNDLNLFIQHLRLDLIENTKSWENDTLERYIEAMAGWVNDMDGFYRNNNLNIEDEPMWRVFARILQASSIYE